MVAGIRSNRTRFLQDCTPPVSGFTLVELLVTISLIAVLAGLLLPALGIARESARRSTCLNNASQIGKSLIGYESDRSALPGWRNTVDTYSASMAADAATRPKACVAWTVAMLPYFDQREIFAWYESFVSFDGVDDVTKKRIPSFVCPSSVDSAATPSRLCYAGNAGTGAEVLNGRRQYRGDGVFLDAAGNLASAAWYGGTAAPEYEPARSSLAYVAGGDGASCTLLIAERSGLNSPSDVSWAANPAASRPSGNAVLESLVILHPPALAAGREPPRGVRFVNPTDEEALGSDGGLRYPSSTHKGGVVATFCDGHTTFLSDSIAPWVYCQLLTADRRARSPRAMQWERYSAKDGQWVHYIFDESDLRR